MSIKVALLDVDGTLVDSNDAHAHAFVEAFKQSGFDVPFQKVRSLIGKGGDKLIPEVTGLNKTTAKFKEIEDTKRNIFQEKYITTIKAFPATVELLSKMKKIGILTIVTSSASKKELDTILQQVELLEYLPVRVTADGKPSKPDADILETALSHSHVTASDAILLGDTPYDVAAASKAGVRCVALRCGGWSDAQLRGAIAIYDNPKDLMDHFEDSPFLGKQIKPTDWKYAS